MTPLVEAGPVTQRNTTHRTRPATPPAIILGGAANALSVARSLGKLGVEVYTLNDPDAFAQHSRHVRPIRLPSILPGEEEQVWADFLLGESASPLHGAVLLSCSDAGITLIARHRQKLQERYLLDDSNPVAQLRMLNKWETYEDAVAAGVPTPRFVLVGNREQADAVVADMRFPLIVKPRLSHVFEGKTGRKLFVVNNVDALVQAVDAIQATGTESLVVEMIPGGDNRLCSYFTYLDKESRPLFQFTKRIIRRYPQLRGTACFHVTDAIPEAVELGNRLFRHVGLRGLANVEFKLDERDGQLKLIECNARFTASDCLVARAGCDLARFVYCRLTDRDPPPMRQSSGKQYLWDPVRDFQAYLQLRRQGELNLAGWVGSILHWPSFPFFEWSDPIPALVRLTRPLRPRR